VQLLSLRPLAQPSLDIGTRRPLILQMINNPSMKSPRCRFRKERLVSEEEDPFESETPTDILSREISQRTDKIVGKGDVISPVPIILRVEYCYCANLTIWDMPGQSHPDPECHSSNCSQDFGMEETQSSASKSKLFLSA
jgi:hypothetical protein